MPTIVLDDYEYLNLLGAFKRMRKLARYGLNGNYSPEIAFNNGDWFYQTLYKLCQAVDQVDVITLSNNFQDTFSKEGLKNGKLHDFLRKKNG